MSSQPGVHFVVRGIALLMYIFTAINSPVVRLILRYTSRRDDLENSFNDVINSDLTQCEYNYGFTLVHHIFILLGCLVNS